MQAPGRVDSKRLESFLKVVAYANRLDLLNILRQPHALQDIRLTPGPANAGARAERPISRQAVAHHVEQLVEAGLVRSAVRKRPGKKPVNEFYVEQSQLYALVEELRNVSTIGSVAANNPLETVILSEQRRQTWPAGPKLVLVHGVYEGAAFPLSQASINKGRGWVIGRRKTAAVPLGYDPYVSLENSEVLQAGKTFKITDLRSSRNGTFLNWERLPIGGEATLTPGDVVGVGRSLLVFRDG